MNSISAPTIGTPDAGTVKLDKSPDVSSSSVVADWFRARSTFSWLCLGAVGWADIASMFVCGGV